MLQWCPFSFGKMKKTQKRRRIARIAQGTGDVGLFQYTVHSGELLQSLEEERNCSGAIGHEDPQGQGLASASGTKRPETPEGSVCCVHRSFRSL